MKLNFYSVFHGNLQFSSIKRSDFLEVINKCYWPLLNTLDKINSLKVCVEFSGETLLEIEKVDSLFISKIKDLISKNRIEFIGSGFTQTIFPLIPADINLKNLELGKSVYQKFFGFNPDIYYINEQTVSDGIIDIYKKFGVSAIIADFDSSPENIRSNQDNLYSPSIVRSQGNKKINVIWSSSIAFQKFQRFIFDEISSTDYNEYIENHNLRSKLFFPLYCGDWEVFGFSPKKIKRNYSLDFENMRLLFINLINHNHNFILLKEILNRKYTKRIFHLTDSEDPVYSKKQVKYNPSRWALAGPNTVWRNTSCYQLHGKISSIKAFNKILKSDGVTSDLDKELVSLWGSDFRTFTSLDKSLDFNKRIKKAFLKADLSLSELLKRLKKKQVAINLSGKEIIGKIVSIPLDELRDYEVFINGKRTLSQVEPVTLNSKGDVLSGQITFVANFNPFEIIDLQIFPKKRLTFNLENSNEVVETDYIRLHLDSRKGATVKYLYFKNISSDSLMGLIPHGFYHNPSLSADWFSGHCLFEGINDRRFVDLAKTKILKTIGNFPIRIPLFAVVNTKAARIFKTYYVYNRCSRIDLKYSFDFKNIPLKSARIGNVTINPNAFLQNSLRYMTVNGGNRFEKYSINNKFIDQDQIVSSRISSKGCLGSTNGFVAVGDEQKYLGVVWDKSQIAACPIIHFENTPQGLYGRIQLSIAESDETGYPEFKGKKDFSFSYISDKHLGGIGTISYNINAKVVVIR